MKIHNVTQGEGDWLKVRAGKVTASEIDALVSPTFEIRKGAQVHTLVCQKVAETLNGGPLPGFTSWQTEEGQMMEDESRKWFAFASDEKLIDAGFCEHDDGRCGCSPDSLIGEDGGLELKNPQHVNHVRYLLDGTLPKDYAAQVHMSLYVTGRKWWKFVSYRRKFPPFVITVERDEKICAIIAEALAGFYAKMDDALQRLGYSTNDEVSDGLTKRSDSK